MNYYILKKKQRKEHKLYFLKNLYYNIYRKLKKGSVLYDKYRMESSPLLSELEN